MSGLARLGDARMRLPREPYPGLRPFLDFEAALLFGRERQVREIIERLAATQFVAVLGGSGSGKSSLIHAGVTPELRSYGIPGAGDLWLPMACTPGTNVSAADRAARRHTPVTRLARRFAQLLRSRGNEAADAERLAAIAEAFRQEAGFARLMEAYADELDVPPGPDPREARVLFVLDQFEEIFHPTNNDVEDAKLLVERVLDHFFHPHPRCYVVLTMRSEHLNDCAAFLELPDAINKSSFLVRRLDADELRQAIEGPAQRFLRLAARSDPERALPERVQFEPAVVDRLLRDVSAITHDPDHLPLLQHLLARLWQSALEREEMDVAVPSHITEIDLVRAVNALAQGDEQPLDPAVNTLRECVNAWPERLYQWHDDTQRSQLEALFRRLAFKDPNTGLYSQQRVDVVEAARLLGPAATPDDLRRLLAEGFLGNVDYLFWDVEDPSRTTLKVSHESFIRGWLRFRRLIDVESAYFDQFVGLARDCADWAGDGHADDDLLDAGDLRRLSEPEFRRRLADPAQRALWARFLVLDRDAARLAGTDAEIDRFVARSERRQQEQRRRETFWRRAGLWFVALGTLLGLIPTTLFTVFIQTPTLQRVELLFDATNLAAATPVHRGWSTADEPVRSLDALLKAANGVDDAASGRGLGFRSISPWLIDRLGGFGPVRRQVDVLGWVGAQAEPQVNRRLDELLGSAIWPVTAASPAGRVLTPPRAIDAECSFAPGAAVVAVGPRGRLFVAAPEAGAAPDAPRRALLVTERPPGDRSLLIYAAQWQAGVGCRVGPSVLSWPDALDSRAVFDASLRLLAFSTPGASNASPALVVQQLEWTLDAEQHVHEVRRLAITVLTDAAAVAAVRAAVGPTRAAPLPTEVTPEGAIVDIGAQRWRVVWQRARPVDLAAGGAEAGLVPLVPASASSVCALLRDAAPPPDPPGSTTMLETPPGPGGLCVRVRRAVAERDLQVDEADLLPEELTVSWYRRPEAGEAERVSDSPPPPIATGAYLRLVDSGPGTPASGPAQRWAVAREGPLAGWLLMRRADAPGWVGMPMSTCALWRVGTAARGSAAPAGVCERR